MICYHIGPIDYWKDLSTNTLVDYMNKRFLYTNIEDFISNEMREFLTTEMQETLSIEKRNYFQDYYAGTTREGIINFVKRAFELARKNHWDGDFKSYAEPCIFFLPDPDECSTHPVLIWKHDNNGSTFIVSEIPLFHLEMGKCTFTKIEE